MECELKCSKQSLGKFTEPGYSVNIKLNPMIPRCEKNMS